MAVFQPSTPPRSGPKDALAAPTAGECGAALASSGACQAWSEHGGNYPLVSKLASWEIYHKWWFKCKNHL